MNRGNNILTIDNLNKTIDGEQVLNNFSLTVNKGDKIAFVGPMHSSKSALYDILAGVTEPDSGTFEWGGHNHKRISSRKIIPLSLRMI